MNTLCNAYVIYLNDKSKYSGFEIVTMIEVDSVQGGTEIIEVKTYEEFLSAGTFSLSEPFYRINAIYKKEENKRSIGDFNKINDAVDFLEDLTGLPVYIYSM